MTVALVVTGVGVVGLRSDSRDVRSVSTAAGSLPPAGISVERIEGFGRAGGTQEIRFVFDGPLPSGNATYVKDIASFDVEGPTTGVGFTTQDVAGSIWVCDDRHFGFGPGASTGSIDLLIPADWFPVGMQARNDPVPWAPGSDAQTVNPPGKIVACGPYKGYVQYSIWSPASDEPEDVHVSLERDSIRVVVEAAAGGPTATLVRTIGDVEGVSVAAEPRDALRDGDLVEVRVTGLAALPGAVILQCAGDVTAKDASEACDHPAVEIQGPDVTAPATEHQVVSVARTIRIRRGSDDPNVARPYDCTTEAAGCVLAVGPYALPVRAVVVPIAFENIANGEPVASMRPAGAIQDGDQVTVTVEGLRPNASFYLLQCRAGGANCTALWQPPVRSDTSGRVTLIDRVSAALYGESGRTDCVVDRCTVVVAPLASLDQLVELPIHFAPDVVAPVPQLSLDPPGPYENHQIVTVRGQGFPKGRDITNRIGQCPADKDTAQEERCGYDLADRTVVVDRRGEFTATIRLYDSLSTGTCVTGPGCVVAWVLHHGPIAASSPLVFRQP